jgi:hypothetical protein
MSGLHLPRQGFGLPIDSATWRSAIVAMKALVMAPRLL